MLQKQSFLTRATDALGSIGLRRDPARNGLGLRDKSYRKPTSSRGSKVKSRALAYIATAGAFFCFGASLSAQGVVTVKFTGSHSTTWDGLDAGIYGGDINGNASPGIICDDFADETYNGESWKANAYEASQLTATDPSTGKPYLDDTLFGSKIGVNGYAEMGMLVSMMFSGTSSFSGITGITQAELASAIWDIGMGGDLKGLLDAKTSLLISDLQSYFKTHSATAYLDSLTNLWILTPSVKGLGEPQEMWTDDLAVPEGGAALLYLLIAGASCFGALFMKKRKLGADHASTLRRLA